MADYLLDLRKEVGSRPLVVAGACGIVLKDQQMLFIQRSDNGFWGLPAGSVEINEDPKTTTCRELLEETGLVAEEKDLTLLNVFGGADFFYTYPNGDACSFVTSSYLIEKFSGEILTETDESTDCCFFPLDQLPKEVALHEMRMIEDFLENK